MTLIQKLSSAQVRLLGGQLSQDCKRKDTEIQAQGGRYQAGEGGEGVAMIMIKSN